MNNKYYFENPIMPAYNKKNNDKLAKTDKDVKMGHYHECMSKCILVSVQHTNDNVNNCIKCIKKLWKRFIILYYFRMCFYGFFVKFVQR